MDLLLHICCAPCSIASWKTFAEMGYRVRGFFYNPNIHPYREFEKRAKTLWRLAEEEDKTVIRDESYPLEEFLRAVSHREKEGERCEVCYRMRLGETARRAAEEGFGCFSTTLLISPYQQHERVREIGQTIAREHGLEFVYADLRPRFRESMEQARQKGLYRQGYCGCIYSEKERYAPG